MALFSNSAKTDHTVTGDVKRIERKNGATVVTRPDGSTETYEGSVTVQATTVTGGINSRRK
ncbi:hypothetical protein HDA32_004722 [Spinactinospora alkalitolerans]|uniref:Uncharacterized protein n=1 Tax=Spinactinospora alkalitolerans TaxID=687207 RepID=A0A852U2G2_9ACTN|nr:hypothetical protein [Spinactinospora alkalitolerans]NYE49602.1 hypothetical protein [Spinactinospora alkalitolerans]